MNYTKGEWTVIGQSNAYMVQAKVPDKIHNLKLIADCYDNKEDAQLIASAPDLYEALKECARAINVFLIKYGNGVLPEESTVYKRAEKALAKAEGR